ncbi:trehalase family glycosidase [Oscillatoria laete-virens NRMC-F 0139]|nr:trehalase family glycosidase [Oscillatoria laete-virens]MDL5052962.1 trehalase family glycosidase [Oscillatoria laete-virens NRMC-F 0139]
MPHIDKISPEARNLIDVIKKKIYSVYPLMYREAGGKIEYPFLTPGTKAYLDQLWDWDSWLTNLSLRQILTDLDSREASEKALPYEQGCVLNFLQHTHGDGWTPFLMAREGIVERVPHDNMHKPCLAQHAAMLVRDHGGDAEWLRASFGKLQTFVNHYTNHHRHAPTGLYYWQNDHAIGVDNDPCTYFRPPKSSGSIYLNCLMHQELLAIIYLSERLNLLEVAANYRKDAEALKAAILEHCWDERDGFFYSVDLNLLPVDPNQWLHSGMPRDWDCLIMRIGVWSGFLALWAQIATPEQAARVVAEHFKNPKTFNAPFGVRTLSKMEKMYNVRASGNPSSWLGPIWGVANYMTFQGLVNYGFDAEAAELAEKTILLFGRDYQRFDDLHEYYEPDTGEPIINRGFENWNFLVMNMIAWLEGRRSVTAF